MFVNGTWNASATVDLFLEGVYTASKAGFDAFELPEPEGIHEESLISPDRPGVSKGAYDFSSIQNYSDLDYRQVDATVGLRVQATPRTAVTGSVTWMHLDDEQPYVYGDLTGSVFVYAAGATIGF